MARSTARQPRGADRWLHARWLRGETAAGARWLRGETAARGVGRAAMQEVTAAAFGGGLSPNSATAGTAASLASSRAAAERVKEFNPRLNLNVSVVRVEQDRQPHLADPIGAIEWTRAALASSPYSVPTPQGKQLPSRHPAVELVRPIPQRRLFGRLN